jgi:hypothetical protein
MQLVIVFKKRILINSGAKNCSQQYNRRFLFLNTYLNGNSAVSRVTLAYAGVQVLYSLV